MSGLLDYKEHAVQSPYGQLIFQFFLLIFLGNLLFALFSITSGIHAIITLVEDFAELILQYTESTYHLFTLFPRKPMKCKF